MRLTPRKTLCGRGAASDQFRERLVAVAIDQQDRLLVVGDQHVKVFSADHDLVGKIDTRQPAWSVCAADGRIWCGLDGAVRAMKINGEPVGGFEDPERLGRVSGLAVAKRWIFAADATHRCLHRYDREGNWQGHVGQKVNTRGFFIPNGVLDLRFDAATQSIVVSHPGKYRVERYGLDGQLQSKFGRFGMQQIASFPGCCNPTNVAVAPSGDVVVTEKATPRMKVYATDGRLLAWTDDQPFDPQAKNMSVAVDSRGWVYVADTARLRVVVFEVASLANGDHAAEVEDRAKSRHAESVQ